MQDAHFHKTCPLCIVVESTAKLSQAVSLFVFFFLCWAAWMHGLPCVTSEIGTTRTLHKGAVHVGTTAELVEIEVSRRGF